MLFESSWSDQYISLVYEAAEAWLKVNTFPSCRYVQMCDIRDQAKAEYNRRTGN